jgi:hypothetical protein
LIRILLATTLALAAALAPGAAWAQEVSVWYRGTPAGTPKPSELASIRALGFQAITWPEAYTARLEELNRLAAAAGLRVLIADKPYEMSPRNAARPAARVDIVIRQSTVNIVAPLAWRAIAHGARAIAFDGGTKTGAGLEEQNGSLKPWAKAAQTFARQISANANLVAMMQPGPKVTYGPVDPRAEDVVIFYDVALLDAGRAWVVIATNLTNLRREASVRFPKDVPYALWVSWLEGPPLAMLSEPAGPRWMLTMAPRSAQVYIIDKTMK